MEFYRTVVCTSERQVQQNEGIFSIGLKSYLITFLAFGFVEASGFAKLMDFQKFLSIIHTMLVHTQRCGQDGLSRGKC